MFKNIFGNKGNSSKTGFFQVQGGVLIEIVTMPGEGSINDYIESLGFPKNHIRMVHTFNSDKIECLGFKTLSRELVLVMAKSPETKISYSDVLKEINQIDWDFEYSSLHIEDILEEGIELENLDLKFLHSVIDLIEEGDNIYKSEKVGMYLHFEDGMLKAFTSSGWDNSATKWLRDLNPEMVDRMTEEARLYHQNDIDSMEEVNNQAKSLLGVPQAINNEYLPLHTKQNGNVNFYNLLITHYNKECSIEDFVFMNKGRYKKIGEYNFEVGRFVYHFDSSGRLENAFHKK